MAQISVTALDHLVLTVTDMEATIAFYTKALGMTLVTFQPTGGPERRALRFGNQKINLHAANAPFVPHAQHPKPGSADLCFLTDTPLQTWIEHLALQDVAIENGPVPRSGATARLSSIYIRDPDGNLIELSNITP